MKQVCTNHAWTPMTSLRSAEVGEAAHGLVKPAEPAIGVDR